MHVIHSSLDKQTITTQESDTGEFNFSTNISYRKVNMKSNGFKNEEDEKEDTYDYVYSNDT